jgi:hypothetical protein
MVSGVGKILGVVFISRHLFGDYFLFRKPDKT